MMKMIFLFCFAMGSHGWVFSSNFSENLIGNQNLKNLLAKGSLSTELEKEKEPSLLPDYPYLVQLIEKEMRQLKPSVIVESLNLYKKPSHASLSVWTENEKKALFNEILALSSLKGLEYFSKSKGKMRVLYEESDIIENAVSKKIIENPICHIIPDSMRIYAKQKDSTFGENIFSYDYFCQPEAFIFIQENLTSMNYGVLSLIGKNKLRSIVTVFDAEEYLLIYVISMAKASSVPWMEKRVKESFSNRINALLNWFNVRADIAYEKLKEE